MTSRTKVVIAAAVIGVLALGGAGLWWFLRDDAPAEVSLEAAVESAEETGGGTTTPSPDGSDPDGSDPDGSDPDGDAGIAGTWVVDAETGDFDFESATGTFAGFRIQEELASIGSTTAVGRTGDVSGSIAIEGTTLTEATFEVDLTTITTNESRRDDRVQSALDTATFPMATFTLTEPVELGPEAGSGGPVQVTAVGELTIHGVTQPVEVPIEAQLVDGTIALVGSTEITFSDFDVTVPSSPVVLSVEDSGTLEVQLLLIRG